MTKGKWMVSPERIRRLRETCEGERIGMTEVNPEGFTKALKGICNRFLKSHGPVKKPQPYWWISEVAENMQPSEESID
ncbi:hypothetical protein GWI33_013560 [Rhynchophorus ferrugineus]|uniref:Uncharacterized protein n=1 Tax=Rhynchophorus ferrugineus TaxID=354439 RepID=A0A834I6T1_RHYFE|nr:hypothetical protein GWI33_013560 [Rhynchophorus ferrugineus]